MYWILVNQTVSGVRSGEKQQEAASSLARGDPGKGWGCQAAPGDRGKDVSHFPCA